MTRGLQATMFQRSSHPAIAEHALRTLEKPPLFLIGKAHGSPQDAEKVLAFPEASPGFHMDEKGPSLWVPGITRLILWNHHTKLANGLRVGFGKSDAKHRGMCCGKGQNTNKLSLPRSLVPSNWPQVGSQGKQHQLLT